MSGTHVLIEGRHTETHELHRVRSAHVRRGWFGTRLDLDLVGADAAPVFGLPHAPTERFAAELTGLATEHRARTAAAAVPIVQQAAADVAAIFDGSAWVKRSQSEALAERLDRVAELCDTAGHCFDEATARTAADLAADPGEVRVVRERHWHPHRRQRFPEAHLRTGLEPREAEGDPAWAEAVARVQRIRVDR